MYIYTCETHANANQAIMATVTDDPKKEVILKLPLSTSTVAAGIYGGKKE